MAQIKVFYDREGKTLTVWFDNPEQEYVCEETGDEVVLMKNKAGAVMCFERLNYVMEQEKGGFSFEAIAV